MHRRLIRQGPRASPKTTATTASTTTPHCCPPCPPYQLRLSNQGSGRVCKVGKRILRQREVVGHGRGIAKILPYCQNREHAGSCYSATVSSLPPPPPGLHPKPTPAPEAFRNPTIAKSASIEATRSGRIRRSSLQSRPVELAKTP